MIGRETRKNQVIMLRIATDILNRSSSSLSPAILFSVRAAENKRLSSILTISRDILRYPRIY